MSKFCGKCGSVLDDSAVVCQFCGAPASNEAQQYQQYQPNIPGVTDINSKGGLSGAAGSFAGAAKNSFTTLASGFNNMDAQKKEKVKKYGIIGGGVAALVIVLIFVISVITGVTSCEGTAKRYLKAIYKDADATACYDLCYHDIEDYEDYLYDIDDWEEDLEDISERYMDEYGSDYKVKYKVLDSYEYKGNKLEEIKDDIEDSTIKKVAKVTVKIEIEGSLDEDSYTTKLYLVKQGSKWKIYEDEF